jgi:similar to stage IV sporulation protein
MGNDKLSWMSINIRGTTAYVEVKEQGIPPQVVDLSAPSNIYAARDGVILAIRDYGGMRQVEPGSAVAAGDLLVSGDRIDQYGVRHLTKSIATVIAQTERHTSITVPLKENFYQKSGKERKKCSISLGNWNIPLYFNGNIDYNKYDTIEEVYPLTIGSFALPLKWKVFRALELQEVPLERSVEEACSLAYEQLDFYQADRLEGVKILRREVRERLEEDGLTLDVTFYCEEEIGVELPIEN